jgi:sugar phosphate isomerase/epimerase
MATSPSVPVGVRTASLDPDPFRAMTRATAIGFDAVQPGPLADDLLTPDGAARMVAEAARLRLAVTSLCVAFPGEDYSDMDRVFTTVGFANAGRTRERVATTIRYVETAAAMGLRLVTLHVGRIPPDPGFEGYGRIRDASAEVGRVAAPLGVRVGLETGHEPAAAVARLAADLDAAVGAPVAAVNFDPANLVRYGQDDPLAAVDLLAPRIAGVHVKDGLPPVGPRQGPERAPGDGAVPWPALLARLAVVAPGVPLVLERESSAGEADVARCLGRLRSWLS